MNKEFQELFQQHETAAAQLTSDFKARLDANEQAMIQDRISQIQQSCDESVVRCKAYHIDLLKKNAERRSQASSNRMKDLYDKEALSILRLCRNELDGIMRIYAKTIKNISEL